MAYALPPKLVIVDGASASGKSTTCRWLGEQLSQRGFLNSVVYEADVPHPLHWWDYWDGTQHRAPDFDRIEPATYMARSLTRWQDLLATLRTTSQTVIIEGALYCLAINFFVQGETNRTALTAYHRAVQTLVQAVDPFLIYLRQEALARHATAVWQHRGSAIMQELIHNLEQTRYLRQRGLRGFAGILRLWEETQELTDRYFQEATVRKLAIEVSSGDWATAYEQILAAVCVEA